MSARDKGQTEPAITDLALGQKEINFLGVGGRSGVLNLLPTNAQSQQKLGQCMHCTLPCFAKTLNSFFLKMTK